jgi:2-dehydro-3-deoxy-D-arabinonate dehydratase
MHLYRSRTGNILVYNSNAYLIEKDWDEILAAENLHSHLLQFTLSSKKFDNNIFEQANSTQLLPPIGKQEVWAAGVTYLRSRDARMDESKESGGSDFYQKVYTADRPELFFKATARRVSGPGEDVYIRKDSTWNVPEPELTLFINRWGSIQGYTVGNDMSSRSIEGENPLYLPQAKTYERSAALGPCIFVPEAPIDPATTINILIQREEKNVFEGKVSLKQMKRQLPELAGWLFKELDFPDGCFLMTGTGIIPPDHFSLLNGDRVTISIENIGTLSNTVSLSS